LYPKFGGEVYRLKTSGIYVVSDNLDGAGGSTLVAGLVNQLRAEGIGAIGVKEPNYEAEIGKLIQRVLRHELHFDPIVLQRLFAADRHEQLITTVLPALENGLIVVSDRSFITSAVWAGLHYGYERIFAYNEEFPWPDVVLHIEIDPSVTQERIVTTRDRIELFEREKTQRNQVKSFGKVWRYLPSHVQLVKLDGALSPRELQHQAFGAVVNFHR
jgi:dTMP kinase